MLKKKIKHLFIGTNNVGKLKEIRDLVPDYINISSILNFKIKSPKEIGNTFEENSIIKSKYFSKKTKMVCLADDSGLEIDILDKRPGIYSARWAGKKGNFKKAIKRIYKELAKKEKNWKIKKIRARFICSLSLFYLNKKIACVTGKVEGIISNKPKGNNGFGYDPIFIPLKKRKTFAQMKPSDKYKIDHRYRAFNKLKFL